MVGGTAQIFISRGTIASSRRSNAQRARFEEQQKTVGLPIEDYDLHRAPVILKWTHLGFMTR